MDRGSKPTINQSLCTILEGSPHRIQQQTEIEKQIYKGIQMSLEASWQNSFVLVLTEALTRDYDCILKVMQLVLVHAKRVLSTVFILLIGKCASIVHSVYEVF